jgi:GTP-binding protein EngB required for normal cell division
VIKVLKSENVAVMVAVTKIDKCGGPEQAQEAVARIERDLAARDILTENMGGEVQLVSCNKNT